MKHLIVAAAAALIFYGCSGNKNEKQPEEEPALPEVSTHVSIATNLMDIVMQDTLLSGLNHLTYENRSGMTHFLMFNKVPQNIGVREYTQELTIPFQEVMNAIAEGTEPPDNFPEWLGEMVNMGGVGLISGGQTAESYVDLEPGNYIVECYIKTNGIFHSTSGMVRQITVLDQRSDLEPPPATLKLQVDSNGISINGEMPLHAGQVTFSVNFGAPKLFPNFTGPDVHLARITGETDLTSLEDYMDWTKPNGMIQESPATFLGGSQDAPDGKTSFFTQQLSAGKYVLIGEVPGPSELNFYQEFEVIE
jgi:hypothetical protein